MSRPCAVLDEMLEAHIQWRDVFGAAALPSFLFAAPKWVLAWYFAKRGSHAAYGAVARILGLLTWRYVASLPLFCGAEWSRVSAERFGNLAQGPASLPRSGPA